MKFIRLRVANYRGITSADVTFLPTGITMVQGPNEVGKTSLGEAIRVLFEYQDSSKHREVQAIRPVHRDEGPEIELQAESGLYTFTYFKRFYKKPETRLTISMPKPENHTGREAHDRAEAILKETLDIDLWKALTIQQGNAIEQPSLGKQTSLSAALDKAAGGRTSDPLEEGLFEKVQKGYLQFCTEKGAEKKDLPEARKALIDAKEEVVRIEEAIRALENDIDRAAVLKRELRQLDMNEKELVKEAASHTADLEEISALESALEAARLKLEAAQKSEEMARRDKESRFVLVAAVEDCLSKLKVVEESSSASLSALTQADDELKVAQSAFAEADQERKDADALAVLRRADYDYYLGKLHLEQLKERKDRIDEARKLAAQAEEFLARTKVKKTTLAAIQEAERAFLTANAQLEMGSPNVLLRGLSRCTLAIDDSEIVLGKDEIQTIAVPDKSKVTIPNILEIEVTAGTSTDELAIKVDQAKRSLEKACAAAGVSTPDEARRVYDEATEASRHVKAKSEVEKENLRDLTYEDLERKVYGLQKGVPDYLESRVSEPAIYPDLDSANKERAKAEAAQKEAVRQWESAQASLDASRKVRDGLNIKHQEARVQMDMLSADLKRSQEKLHKARMAVSDDTLDNSLADAVHLVEREKANVASADGSLRAKNPERIKALVETAKGSLKTTQDRMKKASTELTEVQTRLKMSGEEGLHEKLHKAKTRLERISHETGSLLRRAAAARLLFETMRDERDKARKAYVTPLKEKIEGLGRLVFDESLQVEITDALQIASRTTGGITVPYESLSGGTKEQLSLIFRLACSMIVAKNGGTPLILDDTLGYTDPERLKLMGTVLAKAAKECQIVIFTCVPNRYNYIGEASIVAIG